MPATSDGRYAEVETRHCYGSSHAAQEMRQAPVSFRSRDQGVEAPGGGNGRGRIKECGNARLCAQRSPAGNRGAEAGNEEHEV